MEGNQTHSLESFVLLVVEYWRNRHQRMNMERFLAANTMALVTHGLVSTPIDSNNVFLQLQPLDLVKTRS